VVVIAAAIAVREIDPDGDFAVRVFEWEGR
jgi:hypothetical protein